MSLNEFTLGRQLKEDKEVRKKKESKKFDFQKEKGEGLEALLGSVNTYASQTQALLLIPFTLFFIMTFTNETKIAVNYGIRKNDIKYYMSFTTIIVLP